MAEAINAQHSLKKKGKVASFSSTAAADVASTRRFYAFKVPNKSGYRILIFETTNGETRKLHKKSPKYRHSEIPEIVPFCVQIKKKSLALSHCVGTWDTVIRLFDTLHR